MGFSFETSVPALTVFLQGLLSFFSPCILPLIPLYLSYLAGSSSQCDAHGQLCFPRKKVFVNTLFFVIGISFSFFLLGFGFTAFGQFLNSNHVLFSQISGIIMIVFGFYQFGFLARPQFMEREHRLPFHLEKWNMGPLPALVLGFTFSFAWTPCVGPILGSVMLMAGNSSSVMTAFGLISLYTLGFILPFLAVGIFTTSILNIFKNHQNIVQYTTKIGAVLLILMGVMTFFGYISNDDATTNNASSSSQTQSEASETADPQVQTEENSTPSETQNEAIAAPDFTLTDQNGVTHTLSDYQGKTIFLNFWATWCPPCKQEMPDIQALYERYGSNEKDLIVLGVAGPNQSQEGSVEHITSFLTDNQYSFPVLMDEDGEVFATYEIYSFPTTFMIDQNGDIFGYSSGALSDDMMENIVQQTMSGERK